MNLVCTDAVQFSELLSLTSQKGLAGETKSYWGLYVASSPPSHLGCQLEKSVRLGSRSNRSEVILHSSLHYKASTWLTI